MEGKKSKRDLQLPVEENLLPGIPCEVTLTLIVPKLSWRDIYSLSSVNRAWNYAVRSRQIYDERLRAHSTATFFPGYRSHSKIAFCSMGAWAWYKLPKVPNVAKGLGVPHRCGCVSMDGKIYVLGRTVSVLGDQEIESFETVNQVFVFDVAAGGKWEQCASMEKPRNNFPCWTQDGKIYVFGGSRAVSLSSERPVSGGEVYDPVKNAWSPIETTHLYMGANKPLEVFEDDLATYNALEDAWTLVNFQPERHLLFKAQGKTYYIRRSGRLPFPTQVFVKKLVDVHENRWEHSHSFSFNGILPRNYVIDNLLAILEVEDDLLAVAKWTFAGAYTSSGHYLTRARGNCLLQSRGFGNGNIEISWELRALNFALYEPYTQFEDVLDKSLLHFVLKL